MTRFDKVTAYWTERGWSEQGPIKLQSRIDTPAGGARGGRRPRDRHRLVAAHRRLEGAGAGHKGEWHDAELGGQPTKDSWRLWSWLWPGATEGDHTLQCRAVDALGRTQTEQRQTLCPTAPPAGTGDGCSIVAKG